MVLQYYVVENETGKQIEIDIESATNEDLTSTKEKWQSDWTSEFIRDPKLEKYAAKFQHWVHIEKMITEYLFLLLILKRILRVIRQLAQCGNTQALAE